MFRKISLPLLAIASFASAAEVSLHGTVEADLANNLDKSWKSNNSANQDIDLTVRSEFDEKTAVEVYITNYSTTPVPGDTTGATEASVIRSVDGRQARIDDENSRWGSWAFDGLQFQWEFYRKAKFVLGDLTWSGGAMNYYGYSSSQEYGSISKDTWVRGVGFELGDRGSVYLGAPDANNHAVWGYAGYTFSLVDRTEEKWSVRPLGDMVFKNGGRERRWTFGTETDYSRSLQAWNYGIHAAWGALPYHSKTSYTFLVEPSLNIGDFSLAGTFYQALLGDEDAAAADQTDIPSEQFVYIEPGISVHPKFSMGLGGEYHDFDMDSDGNKFWAAVPTFYLYPSEEVSITFWTKYQWVIKGADLMSFGVAGKAEF